MPHGMGGGPGPDRGPATPAEAGGAARPDRDGDPAAFRPAGPDEGRGQATPAEAGGVAGLGRAGDPAAFRAAGRYRDALASGEYRAVAGAFVVSMLGSVVAGLALTVLIYRQTASSLLSALAFALTFLPYAVGGTLMSGLVDRVRPRRLLAGCDLGSAALVAVMTLPGLPVPALLALQFGLGLLAPLSAGGRAALLPDVLPPAAVVPGRSLLRVIAQAAQIAGYAAGGGLLAGLPPRAVLGVEAGAFAASALVQRVFLRPRPARSPGPPRTAAPPGGGRWRIRSGAGSGSGRPLVRDSLGGVREVLAIPSLRRAMLLGWVVPFLVVAPEGLAAPAVAARGLPPSAAGWWMMALPAGTVAGELAGLRLIPAARRGRLAAPLAACGLVPLLGFAARPPLPVALGLLAACGLCGAYLLGVDQRLLETSPPALLGRVYTVYSAVLMTVQGLGFAGAGALAEALPPDLTVTAAGAAGLACVGLLSRPTRRARPGGARRPRGSRRSARRRFRRSSRRRRR